MVREDNYIMHSKAIVPLTREEVLQFDSKLYASRQNLTLIRFRKIGCNCVDIKLRLVNGKEEIPFGIVTVITAKQADPYLCGLVCTSYMCKCCI